MYNAKYNQLNAKGNNVDSKNILDQNMFSKKAYKGLSNAHVSGTLVVKLRKFFNTKKLNAKKLNSKKLNASSESDQMPNPATLNSKILNCHIEHDYLCKIYHTSQTNPSKSSKTQTNHTQSSKTHLSQIHSAQDTSSNLNPSSQQENLQQVLFSGALPDALAFAEKNGYQLNLLFEYDAVYLFMKNIPDAMEPKNRLNWELYQEKELFLDQELTHKIQYPTCTVWLSFGNGSISLRALFKQYNKFSFKKLFRSCNFKTKTLRYQTIASIQAMGYNAFLNCESAVQAALEESIRGCLENKTLDNKVLDNKVLDNKALERTDGHIDNHAADDASKNVDTSQDNDTSKHADNVSMHHKTSDQPLQEDHVSKYQAIKNANLAMCRLFVMPLLSDSKSNHTYNTNSDQDTYKSSDVLSNNTLKQDTNNDYNMPTLDEKMPSKTNSTMPSLMYDIEQNSAKFLLIGAINNPNLSNHNKLYNHSHHQKRNKRTNSQLKPFNFQPSRFSLFSKFKGESEQAMIDGRDHIFAVCRVVDAKPIARSVINATHIQQYDMHSSQAHTSDINQSVTNQSSLYESSLSSSATNPNLVDDIECQTIDSNKPNSNPTTSNTLDSNTLHSNHIDLNRINLNRIDLSIVHTSLKHEIEETGLYLSRYMSNSKNILHSHNIVDHNSFDHNRVDHNSFDNNAFNHNSFDHNAVDQFSMQNGTNQKLRDKCAVFVIDYTDTKDSKDYYSNTAADQTANMSVSSEFSKTQLKDKSTDKNTDQSINKSLNQSLGQALNTALKVAVKMLPDWFVTVHISTKYNQSIFNTQFDPSSYDSSLNNAIKHKSIQDKQIQQQYLCEQFLYRVQWKFIAGYVFYALLLVYGFYGINQHYDTSALLDHKARLLIEQNSLHKKYELYPSKEHISYLSDYDAKALHIKQINKVIARFIVNHHAILKSFVCEYNNAANQTNKLSVHTQNSIPSQTLISTKMQIQFVLLKPTDYQAFLSMNNALNKLIKNYWPRAQVTLSQEKMEAKKHTTDAESLLYSNLIVYKCDIIT